MSVRLGAAVPGAVSGAGAAAGGGRGECAGCPPNVGDVVFVSPDIKKLPKAMTEEHKVLLPQGLKKHGEFAHRCFLRLPFLEQPVVPEMPVQKTL